MEDWPDYLKEMVHTNKDNILLVRDVVFCYT